MRFDAGAHWFNFFACEHVTVNVGWHFDAKEQFTAQTEKRDDDCGGDEIGAVVQFHAGCGFEGANNDDCCAFEWERSITDRCAKESSHDEQHAVWILFAELEFFNDGVTDAPEHENGRDDICQGGNDKRRDHEDEN